MKKKRGATLLELVIALAIISIMMVPIMNSVLQSVRVNKKAEDSKKAKLLAQQVVENLRNQDVIETGQILRLSNNELAISSREIKGEFNVESIAEVDGLRVDGIIRTEEVVVSDQYYDVMVGGFLVIDGNNIYYKEATSTYKTFSDFYVQSVGANRFSAQINGDITLEINNENLTLRQGNLVLWNARLGYVKNYLAIIVHNESDYKLTIDNKASKTNIYGFRSNQVDINNGFTEEKFNYIGTPVKRIENILYDHKYRTKGLYSINLAVIKDFEVLEELEYQFNVGGNN
ncbi:MAG: type IV pilus modification PilV family protein [Sarcina sp.]